MLSPYEILRRSEEGPYIEEKEFDKLVFRKARELAKEFDIRFSGEEVVPSDNTLAKSLFEAGYRMALETGFYVIETKRVIKLTEEELRIGMKTYYKEVVMGEGPDARIVYSRKIEDPRRPIIMGGQSGAPIPEEFHYEMALSYALERLVDILAVGGLAKVRGVEVRTRSPAEVLATFEEIRNIRRAIEVAGRPGMPIKAGESSVSAIGALATMGLLRRTDAQLIAVLNDLKTDYDRLSKAFAFKLYGGYNIALIDPVIGGFLGGPEGVAIGLVASNLLSRVIYHADLFINHPIHLKYVSTSAPETIWVLSVVGQAMALNTDFIVFGDVWTSNGEGTSHVFHEAASVTIGNTVSGLHVCGVVATNGKYPNASGLGARYMAKVAIAASRLKRHDANDLVKDLLKIYYPDRLEKPDIGKSFPELYDMRYIQPRPWWLKMYEHAIKEIEDLGLKIEY